MFDRHQNYTLHIKKTYITANFIIYLVDCERLELSTNGLKGSINKLITII
ncbi:hypothetical protein NTGBS_450005 [Candidatus Nitrotoga sp. BS]|nr:hypothetical protein NTGBS_450005 [Candidatus Nitrotoga sp. BS]